jgi:hypothetical protein
VEFTYENDVITLEKELSPLDEFTLAFTRILDKNDIRYVLISGYVAILFGRSRSSEDIDLFIEKMDYVRFKTLWVALYGTFECLATEDAKTAYDDYLNNGLALRFSVKGSYLPNMEIKFPKKEFDEVTLRKSLLVRLNGEELRISPLEVQIPFKLLLGSDKDIEDARHLYAVFSECLNEPAMEETMRKLEIPLSRLKELQ